MELLNQVAGVMLLVTFGTLALIVYFFLLRFFLRSTTDTVERGAKKAVNFLRRLFKK